MSRLGIDCPFCGQKLAMETYVMRKGYAPTMTVYCDNDQCEIKPSTIDTSHSKAFADVSAWGSNAWDSPREEQGK